MRIIRPREDKTIFLFQVRQLKMMIAKAGSLQEMERLQQMLKAGQMPGMETQNGAEEMEQ